MVDLVVTKSFHSRKIMTTNIYVHTTPLVHIDSDAMAHGSHEMNSDGLF